ncbi:MAG: SUMF1/EgtB/PvdO family nonheme iron enzyme [Cyanobacteria bacterium P01_C01_bin.121]
MANPDAAVKDVFISYTSADQAWAEWLAWVLEENDYTVETQSLASKQADNFSQVIREAGREHQQVLLVVSEALLKADDASSSPISSNINLGSAFLVPVEVDDCEPPEYIADLKSISLVEKTEVEAEQTLLGAMQTIFRPGETSTTSAESQEAVATTASSQSFQQKELNECDPSKILFLKNVRDPSGEWAYTPEIIQQMATSPEGRVFELYWPSNKGVKSPSKGDLMILNQRAKITHVVEMLDDNVRENPVGYFRWVQIVWMPDEEDWSQLPHQREVLGFEPPAFGGTAYSLANLSELQKRWKRLEAFQQHVFQVLTGTSNPQGNWDEDYEYRDQLKLRQRTATVQGYRERLTDDLSIEMLQISAGRFVMGSPEDEPKRDSNEGPQHEVQVPAFFMGMYPVTQAEWRWVAENVPQVNQELKADPASFKGDRHPVESVSWYEAVEFCDRLSQHTGRTYRLPSEAEWEYACRGQTAPPAGDNSQYPPFYFGETITTTVANYRGTDWEEMEWSGSYGRGPKGEHRQTTTPVDHFGVTNAFGLCDLHGNVFEWCLAHYHSSYEGAPTDGSAWIDEEAAENELRILRGGSWVNDPRFCRCASRTGDYPRVSNINIGFRVMCVAPRTLE